MLDTATAAAAAAADFRYSRFGLEAKSGASSLTAGVLPATAAVADVAGRRSGDALSGSLGKRCVTASISGSSPPRRISFSKGGVQGLWDGEHAQCVPSRDSVKDQKIEGDVLSEVNDLFKDGELVNARHALRGFT